MGLMILPWGGGIYKSIALKPKATNISLISNSLAVHGLAKLSGLKAYSIHESSTLTQLMKKLLRSGPILVHFERLDEESHKKTPLGKLSAIEEIDSILEDIYLETGCPIAILVDHGSSTRTGMHFKPRLHPFILRSLLRRYREVPAKSFQENLFQRIGSST